MKHPTAPARVFIEISSSYFVTFPKHSLRPFLLKKKCSGQFTRAGQMALPPKTFAITPWLPFLRDQYEIFGSWYLRVLVSVTWGQVSVVTSLL